ncbi:hypothetical protein CSC70_10115 [Pseudoxanthomonas kalamensis DSM 18571]|uniref:J domain-containing protein n=1 Tax=Pseudoxanthomonas kalamensis TaxID=289483 RepID=UPI001B87C477|nr:J domain-containing protein [Pseudoxanthomonas kalamensis]KAF1710018.1 hypothetical protein CSC70_10115 [Pseudoxanthomonas kalamensis DSM 18571]
MNSDFSLLYSQLDLEPGCSLGELSRAYRKRVAELHPDRQWEQEQETSEQLATLISLYKQAIQFHAAHGRLPGSRSTPIPVRLAHTVPLDGTHSPDPDQGTSPPPKADDRKSSRKGEHWLLILSLGLVCWLMLRSYWTPVGDTPDARQTPPTHSGESATPGYLHAGMDMDSVLAIQGPPTMRNETLWEYGPSWLRFEEGKLVDWYSSPLYRLKIREHSPRTD